MKTMLFALALLAAPLARADIPHAPDADDFTSKNISGEEAEDMYKSIKGHEIPGDQLRTMSSTYKVKRNEDGTEQTICSVTISRISKSLPLYHCTIEKSKNGKPIPVFHPLRRMG